MPASNKSLARSKELTEFLAFKSGMVEGVRRHFAPHLCAFIYRYTGAVDYARYQIDEIFSNVATEHSHFQTPDALQRHLDELAMETVLSYLMVNMLGRIGLQADSDRKFGHFELHFMFLLEEAINATLTRSQKQVYQRMFKKRLSAEAASAELEKPVILIELYLAEAIKSLSNHFENECFTVLPAYFLKIPKPTSTLLTNC